jgi:serine/threonine protein kinase
MMIGSKLAHYEITGHLGTGGMGEVYQATDAKLGRSVAIKLLPDVFTHDAGRTERFEREARVLASLNHPNIAAIHGLDESGGRKFLVMELVPGETLAERIQRGPIPLEEAVTIANQLLDGLEAAHEKGVIHRDLKPANIKLTPQGQLKVLDFGLAKAMSGANASATARSHQGISGEPDPVRPGLSNSPTMLSVGATNDGMILGTAAYMSPEQARGRAVDRRTDIFAFGCVFYEMLTGKPAFGGEDVAEILSRVIQREPDWSLLPQTLPPGIRQVLRLCLEKDLRKRRTSAGDVRIDIEQALTRSESAPVVVQKTSLIPWLATAMFAIAAAVITWTHFREKAPETAPVMFDILPRIPGARSYASVSPDGRWLAYYDLSTDGRPTLFVRDLGSTESHVVPGSGAATNVGAPIWSTDSREVAFTSAAGLMAVAPEGGAARKVLEVPFAFFGSWNQDRVLLRGMPEGILRASASDTLMSVLLPTKTQEGDKGYLAPAFLPDGRHYLFGRPNPNPERAGIYVASLDAAESPKRLTNGTTAIAARDPGSGAYYLLVIRDDQLTAQRFDVNRLELQGEAQAMGSGLQVSASNNGVLSIQRKASTSAVLAWYDTRGKAVRSLPPESLHDSVDLSPDGSRLAVNISGDLWLRDLLRGTTTRFTTDANQDVIAIWSPLGDRIVFDRSTHAGQAKLYIKPSNGASPEELLLSSDNGIWANDWSRDGRFLIYSEGIDAGMMNLWVLPMDQPKESRKPISYLSGPFNKKQAQFSPNGRFVAYTSNESGRPEIYVQPFPDATGGKWLISSGGGVEARWSKDGNELLYFSGTKLMSVEVKTAAAFSAGAPRELFDAPVQPGYTNDGHRWQIAPDGTFLLQTFPEQPFATPITIIANWPALLKKK